VPLDPTLRGGTCAAHFGGKLLLDRETLEATFHRQQGAGCLGFAAIIKGYGDCLPAKNHMGVCEDKTFMIDNESRKPAARLTRLLILKGSSPNAEIETTEGETR